MPYHDSEYPSVLRMKDKRTSQRLLAAAPDMLVALREFVWLWEKGLLTKNREVRMAVHFAIDTIAEAQGTTTTGD